MAQPRFGEFVALVALLMATVAYSVDAMLPLLPIIGAELSPQDPAEAHKVILVFMAGLGMGTFVMGPLSDALGRRRLLLGGLAVYMAAAVAAALAQDLTTLLVARFVQALGASAPRVIAQALVRDQFQGRMMARVLSFSTTLFTLVPAIAPFMGAILGRAFGWPGIFWSFVVFGAILSTWIALRQPETLPPERRRPLALATLWEGLRMVLSHRQVRLYLAALTLTFTLMLLWISSVASIFDETFDRVDSFPAWFAAAALLSAPSSLLNARFVLRLGMARLIGVALGAQVASALLMLALWPVVTGQAAFALFMAFMLVQFFSHGFLIGNLYALALEPMGHVAGMTASVMGGVSTVGAALIAGALAVLHDGTPVPLALASLACLIPAMGVMAWARQVA